MNLNDMKISNRLILGFGTLVLLIAAMGAVSLVKIRAVDNDFKHVVNDYYPTVRSLNEVQGQLNQIARSMRNMVITTNQPMRSAMPSRSRLRASSSSRASTSWRRRSIRRRARRSSPR